MLSTESSLNISSIGSELNSSEEEPSLLSSTIVGSDGSSIFGISISSGKSSLISGAGSSIVSSSSLSSKLELSSNALSSIVEVNCPSDWVTGSSVISGEIVSDVSSVNSALLRMLSSSSPERAIVSSSSSSAKKPVFSSSAAGAMLRSGP